MAPAWVAAFAAIRVYIADPRSAIPNVKIKKNGAKIAASTAAVARVQQRICFSNLIAPA
jgi:hypothetical protein